MRRVFLSAPKPGLSACVYEHIQFQVQLPPRLHAVASNVAPLHPMKRRCSPAAKIIVRPSYLAHVSKDMPLSKVWSLYWVVYFWVTQCNSLRTPVFQTSGSGEELSSSPVQKPGFSWMLQDPTTRPKSKPRWAINFFTRAVRTSMRSRLMLVCSRLPLVDFVLFSQEAHAAPEREAAVIHSLRECSYLAWLVFD